MIRPTYSPWGPPQSVDPVGPGIVFVTTSGHGGFKLDAERNAQIPPKDRRAGGWYEEDCEYSIVILAFPHLFTDRQIELARGSYAHWYGGSR